LKLLDHTQDSLAAYTAAQIAAIIPDGRSDALRAVVAAHLPETLERLHRCINAVAPWRPDQFNTLQSSQYCTYLYFLANTIWRREGDAASATRLFLLNKALNGIDLFYEIAMPQVFYIGHSVGIVLAKATYGEFLVLYQNSTIGRHKEHIPTIGEGVVVYPNSAIVGRSVVEDGAVISQGTSVINARVPKEHAAFRGADGALAFRPSPPGLLSEYFRR
jgi:serine O-acetyltransferase